MMDLVETYLVGEILNEEGIKGATQAWQLLPRVNQEVGDSTTTYFLETMPLNYCLIEIGHFPYERSMNFSGKPNEILFGSVLGIFHVLEFVPHFCCMFQPSPPYFAPQNIVGVVTCFKLYVMYVLNISVKRKNQIKY